MHRASRITIGLSLGLHAARLRSSQHRMARPLATAADHTVILRGRREYGEDEQPAATGIADAVRHTFGCDQQDSSLQRNVAGFEQEQTLAFNDVVDLVHAFMRVQCMLLPRLERIQADHDVLGPEESALPHSVWRVDGVVAGLDRDGMFHRVILVQSHD